MVWLKEDSDECGKQLFSAEACIVFQVTDVINSKTVSEDPLDSDDDTSCLADARPRRRTVDGREPCDFRRRAQLGFEGFSRNRL